MIWGSFAAIENRTLYQWLKREIRDVIAAEDVDANDTAKPSPPEKSVANSREQEGYFP